MNIICKSAKEVIKASESIKASTERNDCFVYALGTAFDLNYDEAHAVVKNTFQRGDRGGTKNLVVEAVFIDMINTGKELNGKKVIARLDKPSNFYRVKGQEIVRTMRVESFAKKFSEGTYLILVSGHALTVRDGAVIDVCKKPSIKSRVKKAYRIVG